jgi:glycosyltransferase involved in cell wall biosynthesis
VRLIDHGDELPVERGSVFVCIPAGGTDARPFAGAHSVREHTDPLIPVIVVGSRSLLGQAAEELGSEPEPWIGMASSSDLPTEAINTAIGASFPADVALLIPGVRVGAGWLERVRAAALSDSTIASATPLCLGSGGVGLELGDRTNEASFDQLAERVATQSPRLRPKIAVMGPGCVYMRRSALELAGPLDESLALDDALADLALRLSALGMVHVLADDVLVAGDLNVSPSKKTMGPETETSAQELVAPIEDTVGNDEHGPLRRAQQCARAAVRGLSVTIDGRALTSAAGGTQTYIIELVLALARARQVAVRVLVPPDLSERAADALARVPDVELLAYEDATHDPPRTDVVHRPQQVFTPADLALLRLVGERIVIGQQDLIAYHNPSYHADFHAWRTYRRTTRLALAGADQTIFFSEHARRDTLAEDLLPAARAHVIGVGAEPGESADPAATAPEGVRTSESFILCLGADYAHKNRPFAIELVGALHELGWDGRLVLAGAHVAHGSSREHERRLLERRPELAGLTLDLGPVDEPGRRWLYAHARALVYPTLYEGFGLIPLEAARSGLPCLFAAQASLAELAGEAATLVPWDARISAAAVLALLGPGPARDRHLAALRSLPTPAWSEIAQRLTAVYQCALIEPPPEAAPRVWQELDRESYQVRLEDEVAHHDAISREYQDAYHSLEERVSTGLPLIDRGGLLTPEQQRGLMRVAGRGRLGSLALKPFGLLGGWGSRDRD